MVIRPQQLENLGDYMQTQFADCMMKHLRANFPDRTRALDDEKLRRLVKWGIDLAQGYGIAFEDDIRRYLEYMMVLSFDFDRNLQTSWAGEILRNNDIDGAQKMSRVDSFYIYSRKGKR